MSKYSDLFLLGSPKYVNIGPKLRLRVHKSWLAEEAWSREEQSKRRAQFSMRAIDLARQIAAEKDISEEEAFGLLQTEGDDRTAAMAEYAGQIDTLMGLMPSGRDQLEDLVTLFFKNRGQVAASKGKWVDTDEWTVQDTRMLPQALLEQVEAFMADEDVKTGEAVSSYEEDGDSEEDEAEKKDS